MQGDCILFLFSLCFFSSWVISMFGLNVHWVRVGLYFSGNVNVSINCKSLDEMSCGVL